MSDKKLKTKKEVIDEILRLNKILTQQKIDNDDKEIIIHSIKLAIIELGKIEAVALAKIDERNALKHKKKYMSAFEKAKAV